MGSVINYEVMFEASSLRCRQIGRAYCRIYVVQQSDLFIGDMLSDSEINSTVTKLARSVQESDFVESFLCRENLKMLRMLSFAMASIKLYRLKAKN